MEGKHCTRAIQKLLTFAITTNRNLGSCLKFKCQNARNLVNVTSHRSCVKILTDYFSYTPRRYLIRRRLFPRRNAKSSAIVESNGRLLISNRSSRPECNSNLRSLLSDSSASSENVIWYCSASGEMCRSFFPSKAFLSVFCCLFRVSGT